MRPSVDPHLAKHFAALNDAALLDALARRHDYTAAAIDVACEEASRRGLDLPKDRPTSKQPWVAKAPPGARSPVITVWSIAIALSYVVTFFELSRRSERPSYGGPGWLGWFCIEVAIMAASIVRCRCRSDFWQGASPGGGCAPGHPALLSRVPCGPQGGKRVLPETRGDADPGEARRRHPRRAEGLLSRLGRVLASSLLLTAVALPGLLPALEAPLYQSDFKPEELAARRQKVLDAIGKTAIAIVQGAPSVRGFEVFRQLNEFYYLTGLRRRTRTCCSTGGPARPRCTCRTATRSASETRASSSRPRMRSS